MHDIIINNRIIHHIINVLHRLYQIYIIHHYNLRLASFIPKSMLSIIQPSLLLLLNNYNINHNINHNINNVTQFT